MSEAASVNTGTTSHHSSNPSSSTSAISKPSLKVSSGASGITLLVADHERFGFSERACYHFDLIETLTQKPKEESDEASGTYSNDTITSSALSSNSNHAVEILDSTTVSTKEQREQARNPFAQADNESCGVISLLECISQVPIKQHKKRKRLLKQIKEFNDTAKKEREKHLDDGSLYCHQPMDLPLHLNFNTRVSFAYELTSMVFCIDASPTLTSTFGNTGHSDGAICAMDRLEKMVRTYFKGLVVPIAGVEEKTGRTVANENASINDNESNLWVPEIAVTVIACYPPSMAVGSAEKLNVLVTDFLVHDIDSATLLADKIVDWATIEVESEIASKLGRIGGRLDCSASSLQDIIIQCYSALSTLPSRGRPIMVLATDCRAVHCDSILDLVRDRNLKDTPLNVLDLSGSHSHRTERRDNIVHGGPNYLTFEVDSPSEFPLIVPDDSEALHNVCKSTRGYFIDLERLQESVKTFAGNVCPSSSFYHDVYFSVKRRKVKLNALQNYTIFSLSPCCPIGNASWGNIPPPLYIQKRRQMVSRHQIPSTKVTFFSYPLTPIRAKGILIMRIMDGYFPRRYGSNSQDDDKVSIQFALKLELGTVLHYEFLYVASPFHNAMVGTAHVKISISGDPNFVQMVKSEYVSNQFITKKFRAMTLREKACNRICQFLKWIREEDIIESRICALDWKDKLIDKSEFLQCLAGLDELQLYRHFRHERFEVINAFDDELEYLLGDYKTEDNIEGLKRLIEAVSSWSTKAILHGKLYFRQLPNSEGNLTHYCLVEIKPSELHRVFAIDLHYFEQVDTNVRAVCSESLKMTIQSFQELYIASRPFSERVLNNHTNFAKVSTIQQSERWELLHEPELLPLVRKRRSYFDNFVLVKFVPAKEVVLLKFVPDKCNRLYLVFYHLSMLRDKAVARIYMDREQGVMNHSLLMPKAVSPLFADICDNVKSRDNKCARALRSRRNLLNIFDGISSPSDLIAINHTEDVQRLLLYAAKSHKRLRFFNESFGKANILLEKLTIDFMLSDALRIKVAEINVGEAQTIGEILGGRWFLVRFDNETLSIVHFPSEQKVHHLGKTFKEMTFFTVIFADLYYYKADMKDSTYPEDKRASEHLSKFFHDLETANKHHYATASYVALRNPLREIKESLTKLDFQAVMECCTDVKIVENIEIQQSHGSREMIGSKTKLTTLLSSMLGPIPGGSPYLYFRGNENAALDEFFDSFQDDDSITVNSSDTSTNGQSIGEDGSASINSDDNDGLLSYLSTAPVFILLTIDGKAANLNEISSINESVSLSAYITVFEAVGKKNKLQHSISSLIISRLNSYIAEQTLEQFLWQGDQIGEVDVDTVKMCLLEAENVFSWSIPLNFYMPNADSMVDASASDGVKEGLESCFFSLCTCLTEQNDLELEEAPGGDFFTTNMNLHGWCWISVPEVVGPVSVYAFHHNGIGCAEKVAKEALDVVKNACHKVNQILLLETMHKSKAASELLIPGDNAASKISKDSKSTEHIYHNESFQTLDLPPGFFACQCIHNTFFKIHEKILLSQAIHALEYRVLNSFAISNRLGVFVYKDEENHIFYIRLSESNADHGVQLLVNGIYPAGASITQQLDRLIKRELMTMGVESISTAVSKTLQFNISKSDVDFVKSFEETWHSLDNEKFSPTDEVYEFPLAVYDPVLVLLYFRQNVSGSTFFNPWQRPRGEELSEQIALDMKIDDNKASRSGIPFKLDHRDFSLIYNATQFQLNPQFQAISTITDKGKEYSRKAGTGMALIEIKLIAPNQSSDGVHITDAVVGHFPGQEFDSLKLLQSLEFKRIERKDFRDSPAIGGFRLRVQVFNTTLHSDAIYRWIELTLNQALASWVVERHLERARLGLCPVPSGILENNEGIHASLSLPISKICPGLPSFGGLLTNICNNLPHPAVKKMHFPCTLKATDVATLSLNCLERGILNPLFSNRKVEAKDILGLQILRLCRSHTNLVDLKHTDPITVQVYDKSTNNMLLDRPMDSPQIIAVYGLNEKSEKVRRKDAFFERTQSQHAPPITSFLFHKVSVDDYLSNKIPGSLSNALKQLMSNDPFMFMRRVAFVLTVNRHGISALFYNFNPLTVESINTKLKDIQNEFLKKKLEFAKVQQLRHFRHSADFGKIYISVQPTSSIGRSSRRVSTNPDRQQVASIPEEPVTNNRQKRRERSILIPTIVGKSVKGSAHQALLHSRQRARANTAKPTASKIGSQRSHQKAKENSGSKSSSSLQQHEKERLPQEDQNYLPPPLKKDFIALQGFIARNALRRSHTIGLHHSMFLSWFLNSLGKELPFLSMDTILRYATAIQTTTFPLIPSAVKHPILFILYFAKTAFSDHTKNITMSKNFVWNNEKATGDIEKSTIYLMQQIKSTTRSDVYLIHEVSIIRLRGIGKVGKCRSWTFMSTENAKDLKTLLHNCSIRRKSKINRKFNVHHREKESKRLTKSSILALAELHPRLKMFMFALNILRRFSKGDIDANISPSQLLCETMSMFPTHLQLRDKIGHWYRLLNRTVLWGKDIVSELHSFDNILKQVSSKATIYEITMCSKDEMCFSGSMPSSYFKDAHFYVCQNENNCPEDYISYNLFVLCCTRGASLERYIFEEGSPFARKLSDHILDLAERNVYKLAKNASTDIDSSRLWSKYTSAPTQMEGNALNKKDYSSKCSLEEIKELRSLSFCKPYSELDPRMFEILTTDLKELENLHPKNLIHFLVDDEVFHHYFYLTEGRAVNKSIYLLYMDRLNVFVIIEFDENDNVSNFVLMGKNGSHIREEALTSSFNEAVEIVDLLAMRWIFESS